MRDKDAIQAVLIVARNHQLTTSRGMTLADNEEITTMQLLRRKNHLAFKVWTELLKSENHGQIHVAMLLNNFLTEHC